MREFMIDGQLDSSFSYFKAPIRNTQPYKKITLSDVAKGIKGDSFKNATDKLRAFVDVDEARQYKGNSFSYAKEVFLRL